MVARELKVGAFVLAGLLILGLVVLLIGQERNMFTPKVTYRAIFEDVQGLKRGSSVRMGGIDVGSVASVGYGPNPKDPHLFVTLEVVQDEARRILSQKCAAFAREGVKLGFTLPEMSEMLRQEYESSAQKTKAGGAPRTTS